MFTDSISLVKVLVLAWRDGTPLTRRFIIGAAVLSVLGGLCFWIPTIFPLIPMASTALRNTGAALVVLGFGVANVVSLVQKSNEEVRRDDKIAAVEKRAVENPDEPTLAWELARVKLEKYLDRNISQVRSIFVLTVGVMIAGFTLISIGVYWAFRSPETLKASVLTVCSGVVVNFIGGTFLLHYRATMSQAKDYVSILERINAVGMSVQILENIDASQSELKHTTTAAIAKQLLIMYSQKPMTTDRKRRQQSDED